MPRPSPRVPPGGGGPCGESSRLPARSGTLLRFSTRFFIKTSRTASCASPAHGPSPPDHHVFEFCENGAKATLWEATSLRCTPEFFARHPLTELRDWSDFELEQQGRLTHPLRYDPVSDRYSPCSWREAFGAIGEALKASIPTRPRFTPRAGRAWKPPTSMRCLRGSTDTTTCPTVRTCVTRRRRRRAAQDDWRRRRHGDLQRFRQMRRHLLLRPEHRAEQPALSASA